MTTSAPKHRFPAHDIKPGDLVLGREVLDVRDVGGGYVELQDVDGRGFYSVPGWDFPVEVDN